MGTPTIITDDAEHSERIAEARRTLPNVTPEQFAALHLFTQHYDVLGVLLTMPTDDITEALARGYQTDGNKTN